MWRSLVWKEWHEQRWRLGFGAALLATMTLIGLRTRIMPDEQIIALTIFVGGVIFPLMVAMGLVAPERADGSIVRLLSLPVRPWKVVAAKGLVGAGVCVGPIVLSGLIAAVFAGDREMSWGGLLGMYAIAAGVAVSMFSWLTAAGVRQPSEARAGLMGVAIVVVWFLAIALCAMVGEEAFGTARAEEWAAMASPFGLIALNGEQVPKAAVIAMQVVSVVAIWCWSARRIGRPGKVVA